MSHQNTALVLSLLLHALVLSCALVFAGNVVQVQPPVRIELAIAATGGDGGPVRAATAPTAAVANTQAAVATNQASRFERCAVSSRSCSQRRALSK